MYRTVGNPRLFLLETRPTWRILLGMEAARATARIQISFVGPFNMSFPGEVHRRGGAMLLGDTGRVGRHGRVRFSPGF
ncbi:hypothetical protein N658DRAFT_47536 [Parathielavia hyrcaniae]|uniref:Uncharacterized protein n=1 Tax=Parathielavia hyrcaniae TaxID=113614 RepID=A0AAN6PU97_9PEZI|nr:hypothetical protein N658DRAFT_47536 [Parathielavia hyrcaniae]